MDISEIVFSRENKIFSNERGAFMSNFDEIMKTLATALSMNSYRESVEKHEILIQELKEIQEKTKDNFLSYIQTAQDDLSNIIQHLFEIPSQLNDSIIRYIVMGIYEEYHENRIEKLEGSICCSDKASYITQMTLKALKQQENLAVNNYLSLACVKDTNEAIQLFWDWYKQKNY